MTIICAMREPGRGVWIGGDTLAINCDTKQYGVKKWIVSEPWAVGVAGQLHAINLLEAHKDALLNDLAGAWDLAGRIRHLMGEEGYSPGQDQEGRGGSPSFGSCFIFAHPGGVWAIGPDFSIIEVQDGELWADGSGRAYALGAGYALNSDANPEERVRAALDAAMRYSDSCGGEPFVHLIEARNQ